MERVFKEKLSYVVAKLQQAAVKISSEIKCVVATISLEDESDEPNKAFYLLSLMLLISLIFLSPDKVPQTFSPTQAETGILEKTQEIARIIKKLMSNLV